MTSSGQGSASSEPVKTSLEFEKHSVALAEQYVLYVHEVRDTYREKPESLAAHFNAMANAKKYVQICAWAGAASLIVDTRNWRAGVAMMGLAAGFGVYNYYKLNDIGKTVRREVMHKRSDIGSLEI